MLSRPFMLRAPLSLVPGSTRLAVPPERLGGLAFVQNGAVCVVREDANLVRPGTVGLVIAAIEELVVARHVDSRALLEILAFSMMRTVDPSSDTSIRKFAAEGVACTAEIQRVRYEDAARPYQAPPRLFRDSGRTESRSSPAKAG